MNTMNKLYSPKNIPDKIIPKLIIAEETLRLVTHRPLLFCMFGLAPALSRASAIWAMPAITSPLCFLGLKEQTRCRGVSTAPTVAAFTCAE